MTFNISLYIDVIMITSIIYTRGGLRTDAYVMYFMILGYTVMKKERGLLLKLSTFSIALYTLSCIIITPSIDFSYSRLLIRIIYILIITFILRDIAHGFRYVQNKGNRAADMAIIDSLTGLYNRNVFRYIEEIYGEDTGDLYAAMLDIDNFKEINDTYGHYKGDEILGILGEIIRKNTRENDISIRYGGEEFLVLLKDISENNVMNVINRISTEFSQCLFSVDDREFSVTISGGISLSSKDHSINEAILEADRTLYFAKNEGKNRIYIHIKDRCYSIA